MLSELCTRHGDVSKVPPNTLVAGTTPGAVLRNWNRLLPELKRGFAIDLTPDEKALLVGGGASRRA